jgi:N4-gp56 family major capsid protein
MANETLYNTPSQNATPAGTASSIGKQAVMDYYFKKALIAVRDHQYFMPLADVRAMPKHMGKKIKQDVYVPMIDVANTGAQGIDALEAVQVQTKWHAWDAAGAVVSAAGGESSEANAIAVTNAVDVAQDDQNLYGSSKDTGAILNKIPSLRENGGRVNRVGFTRTQVEGELLKRGFFTEYTQESMDFDSDSELLSHIVEEALVGANEITEAELQKDLITTATSDGTAYFCSGTASAAVPALAGSTVAAGAARTALKLAVDEVVVYEDLMNLSIALDDNKTPKQTKVISGSRMIDTKTVNGGRIMYIGSELIPVVRKMTDITGSTVGSGFVSVEKYADATNTVHGEIGTVDQFRMVVVPEMQHDRGGGATAANTAGVSGKGGADIFPMLVVGDGAFTTIGFQTDGKSVKFSVNHKKPGKEIASLEDPYGEVGFYSIKWYYGFMALRPERLGIIWTCKTAV